LEIVKPGLHYLNRTDETGLKVTALI